MRSCIRGAALVGGLGLVLGASAAEPGQTSAKPPVSKARAQKQLAIAATRFTENVGQWDARAKFVSRTSSADVWVTQDGATFDFFRHVKDRREGHVVKMTFVGAKGNLSAKAIDPRASRATYVIGEGNPAKTARQFGEVFQHVYPGVDVRYYTDKGQPRYDFVVAPNTDPSRIALKFEGATKVGVEKGGIVLGTTIGNAHHARPIAFQNDGLRRKAVAAEYVVKNDGTVGLKLGNYDRSKTLIVDPLVYGSYYGGEGGWDEVRNVVADLDGGVYLVGSTRSGRFPALQGPYSFNLQGSSDAFVAKLQGDAYANVYATFLGGTDYDYAQYAQLDPMGNLWVAGRTGSINFPGSPATRRRVQYLRFGRYSDGNPQFDPNAGTFRLSYRGNDTAELPFNATGAQVEAAFEAATGLDINLIAFGRLPSGQYRIELPAGESGTIQIINEYTPNLNIDPSEIPRYYGQWAEDDPPYVFGLNPRYRIQRNQAGTANILRNMSTVPTAGSFRITFVNTAVNPSTAETADIAYNATPEQVQAALNALPNLGGGTFTVQPSIFPIYIAPYSITFTPQNQPPRSFPNSQLFVDTRDITFLPATPFYEVYVPSDVFVTRWARTTGGLLNPLPTTTTILGGPNDETIAGFSVLQRDNPNPNDPVLFGFAGNAVEPIREAPFGFTNGGSYIARYRYENGTITADDVRYIGESGRLRIGGFTMDREANGYIAGQIEVGVNNDNPTGAGIFTTTPGVYQDGDKLRLQDIFIRKYSPTNTLLRSSLLGGNGRDFIGGLVVDTNNDIVNSGSAIAVDQFNNVYVTGISQSFNFPRTRGVYGETFTSDPYVIVTKINPDFSQILYSTNLRTNMYPNNNYPAFIRFANVFENAVNIGGVQPILGGTIVPSGIAVDQAGNAYISGMGYANYVNFPDSPAGGTAGDPNEPTGAGFPSIPLVGALDPDWTVPATPQFPTTEGWLTVLNPTATDLLLSTFIGGQLDEMVYAPYVDRFGDVWVTGSSDSARGYVAVGASNAQVRQVLGAWLPPALISPLAFKAIGDQSGGQQFNILFGGYTPDFSLPPSGVPNEFRSEQNRLGAGFARDGFLIKLRVGTPTVQSITLNPLTVPGGLGASSQGTVTLSSAAPAGGADVTIALDSTNFASLDAAGPVQTTTITIPAGQTTGTFTIFTKPVVDNTAVQVRATYLGSFQQRQLNVVPWLQQIAITPNDIVGGNNATGRITLAANAPTGGVTVDLTTDTPSLVSFPGGGTVTVPAGQNTATFTIATQGVPAQTNTRVTASLLGANRSAALTLNTASLLSLTFNPIEVAGLGTTTGTITLDGKAGSTFTVNITGLPNTYAFPATVTFEAGDRTKTFTVTTPLEPNRVVRTVTATRPAQGAYQASSVQGTFAVVTATLKSLTLSPTTVDAGGTSTATVELNTPAPEGGVRVFIEADPNKVIAPATITIPAGAASAQFTVQATVVANATTATITARRSATDFKSATLSIRAGQFGLTLSPASVLGGRETSTGTVTLLGPAGPAGFRVNLTSSDPSVTVPAFVDIPAGGTTATFTITTTEVTSNRQVTITASSGSVTTSAELTVRANGVSLLTINPTKIRGGSSISITITLDAPAGPNGQVVNLTSSNQTIIPVPASRTVPAGQRTLTFSVVTRRVSRTVAATVTASAAGSSASASVTVVR